MIDELLSQFFHTNLLEILGVATGIIGIWLTVKENIWCWLITLGSIFCYTVLFFTEKLYSDTALQVVFFVLSVYGWYEWLRGGEGNTHLAISRVSGKQMAVFLVGMLVFGLGLGFGMQRFTDAALPYPDAVLTSASLLGQYLLARKKIENWLVWIVADVLYVGLFISKGLYLTAFFYGILCILAVQGWREWRKTLQENERRIVV